MAGDQSLSRPSGFFYSLTAVITLRGTCQITLDRAGEDARNPPHALVGAYPPSSAPCSSPIAVLPPVSPT